VDGVSVAGQAGSLRIAESILDTGARLLEATTSASETLLDTPLAQALGVVDGSGTSPDAAALRDELAATPVVREPWTTAGAAGSLWASGSDARIERSTVLGRVDVRTVYGSA